MKSAGESHVSRTIRRSRSVRRNRRALKSGNCRVPRIYPLAVRPGEKAAAISSARTVPSGDDETRCAGAPRLASAKSRVHLSETSISRLIAKRLHAARARCDIAAGRLNAVSPLATLQRGYAIVTNSAGHVVTDANELAAGDVITARLAHGTLQARIENSAGKTE